MTTYCFSKLLLQETLYTALLNSQYPFHSVEQLLEVALQFHLGCYLAENKYTGSVTMHEARLKANSQEKKELCPMYGHQQRNVKELSCELEAKKQMERKHVFIIRVLQQHCKTQLMERDVLILKFYCHVSLFTLCNEYKT